MGKSIDLPYVPDPVPYDAQDLPPFIERELDRIHSVLTKRATATSANEQNSLIVGTVENYQPLFIGSVPSFDYPGGSWDQSQGRYVVQALGLYQLVLRLEVDSYGTGNKDYYLSNRIQRYNGAGDLVREFLNSDSGVDDFPLGATDVILLEASQGDYFKFDATVVHEQFSGSANYKANVQVIKLSD